MVHEMGHFFVTGMMLFHGRKKLVGSGPTRRDAENDLRRQADAHQRALAVELHDTNDAYDLHTEHGADQSEGPKNTFNAGGPKAVPFPGGRNVRAVCP